MKRKQIIVLGLVLMIIMVGVLQYSAGDKGASDRMDALGDTSQANKNLEDIPGAAVYVNNSADPADVSSITDTEANATEATGYFAEARFDRDIARSKQKEELTTLSESGDTANPASLEAQEKLMDVIKRTEIETTVESLIKQRGFVDVLVYMSEGGSVDVIVKASSLSEQEVALISDIVVRHAEVNMENITVRNNE